MNQFGGGFAYANMRGEAGLADPARRMPMHSTAGLTAPEASRNKLGTNELRYHSLSMTLLQ